MRITANISTDSPSLNGNISNDGVNLNGNVSIGEFDPSNLKVRVTNLENNTVGTIDLSYNEQTSILTLTTKNIKDESVGTPKTVEIPTGIKNISYNNSSKEITITLLNDETKTVSIKSSFDELENIYIKQSALQQTIESTGVDIPLILKSGVPTASTLAFKNSNNTMIGFLQISYLLDNKLKFTDASHNTKIVAMTDDLTNFITNTVDNLTNYYLKSETYTKTEVNNLIAAIPKVKMEIVQSLPTASETYWFDNSHTVYLTPRAISQTNNIYDEYVCMRSGTEGSYVYSWEKIGDTSIDLSNYVEKEITSEQTIGPYSVTTYNNVDNQMSMTGLGSTLNRKFNLNDGTELGSWLAVNTLGIIMMHSGTASTPDAQSATSSVDVNVDASYGITINQLADNITKSIIFRNGNVTAEAFIKNGGTSSQFLKADGSIDSNVYSTILVNNVVQSSLSFNSDPQTQILSKIPISDYSNIVTSRILSNISMNYDSSNHGFYLGAQGYYYDNEVKTEVNTGYGLWIKLTDKFTVEQSAATGGLRVLDIDTSKLGIPTKTSDLTNDSGFITNVVDNLTNYYLKSETYTQSQVNALIAAIKTVKLEIVSTLPTADATTYFNDSKTIYAIRNSATSGSDYYEEYITVRTGSEGSYTYSWEKIGDTQIDLSNYVQKTFTIAGIDLQDNITKSELQTALTDSTHNFVTDTEKSTWNAKQNALSTAQQNAVNSGIDATKVAQIATNTSNITNLQNNKVDKNGTSQVSIARIGATNPTDVPSFDSTSNQIILESALNGNDKTYCPAIGFVERNSSDVSMFMHERNIMVASGGTNDDIPQANKGYKIIHEGNLPLRLRNAFGNEQWSTGAAGTSLTGQTGYFQFLKVTKASDWSDQNFIISVQDGFDSDKGSGILQIHARFEQAQNDQSCSIRWLSRTILAEDCIIGVNETDAIRFYIYCNSPNYRKYWFKILSVTPNDQAWSTINYGIRSATTFSSPTANYSAFDGKLDKTTSPRRVYCTNTNGEQVHEILNDSVSEWSVVQRDSRGNVKGKAFYGNTVKLYTNSFWNYSGQRCVHVGTLKAGWDNHTLGGRIYTHNGYNVNDKTQRIIDFNITIGIDGNGTSTIQGFAIRTQGESAGYDWGSEAIYLVKTSSTTWEMYYVMASWSDAVFEMTQAADSNDDFYFDFDSAHDNFVTEPTTYDLKIVPINNNPPKLEIDNNWGVVTGGSKSWYAAWRTEIPVRQNGVTRILKVIGGFTPTGEGNKTVNFRMVWDTNNDVFSTDCLGFYATGIRNGSTANGWEYATWNKSAAVLTQTSEGSVWFAIGY